MLEGDLHDERYNHMKVEIPFSEYLRTARRMYLVTACTVCNLPDQGV
jgi:hypothetical protein